MYESEIIEYTNRHKMEETTAKVFSRLHHMKKIFYKTIQKTSCGTLPYHNQTYASPISYYEDKQFDPTVTASIDIPSDDTISTISGDSIDSGVSTLNDFSHKSSSSSILLLNRTAVTKSKTSHLRCDPSIINYISHNLLNTPRSDDYFDDIDDKYIDDTSSMQIPLAESSRRSIHEHDDDKDQTIVGDDDDEAHGPLTSTLIDRWYSVTKAYTATFHQDLTVRKNELVQVLRSTHPHWMWVRNEQNQEGFVPTDCLINS